MFSLKFKPKQSKKDSFLKLRYYNDNETLLRALSDSDVLMCHNGAASSVDRIETALHAYIVGICKQEKILFTPNSPLTSMFKLICKKHPALNSTDPNNQIFRQILGNINAIISEVHKLRNSSSLAHPNELLSESDAIFTVNLTKVLMQYLDNKFSDYNASFVDNRCKSCRNFVQK